MAVKHQHLLASCPEIEHETRVEQMRNRRADSVGLAVGRMKLDHKPAQTVKHHLARIMDRLGMRSRVALAIYAVRERLA